MNLRMDEPVRDGCEIPPTEVASGVVVMGSPSRESPEAFNTGLSALSCEALVALAQLEDRHIPTVFFFFLLP